jgi:hypothetical protein
MRLPSNVIPLKREPPKPIKRRWVVIARDPENNKWRVRQVKAYGADEAKEAYEKIFGSYQVMGVGKLDSSGWPVKWYEPSLPPNPTN